MKFMRDSIAAQQQVDDTGGGAGAATTPPATDTVPRPMQPDCKTVRGKVPGPANFLLCSTHNHVVDTKTKMIIANSLDEFKASRSKK